MVIRSSLLFLLVAIVLATVDSTQAQESKSCTLRSGTQGRCVEIRSCPSILKIFLQDGPTVKCGFINRIPVVCCPIPLTETVTMKPANTTIDISAPEGYSALLCGRNATRVINSTSLSSTDVAVSGGKVTVREAWPWMVLLAVRDDRGTNWLSSGILINDQWVLSDAYYYRRYEAAVNVARLGEYDYDDDADGAHHEEFNITETIFYPSNTYPRPYHNLALLKVATKVTFKPFIRPVCLPWGSESSIDLIGQKVTKTGWGLTKRGDYPSPVLEEVELTVSSTIDCNRKYSELGHFLPCLASGHREGDDVCRGPKQKYECLSG
ncbi:venom protease-like [Panulirus ornatus]|uniref:venom protease-like n=1 Tax=Panulirus ornatus TaxID=150431 RepID=UPI003A8BEF13